MGISTECDVCPFVAHDIYCSSFEPEDYNMKLLCNREDNLEVCPIANGWSFASPCAKIGKHEILIADFWVKVDNEDLAVYIVNESQYSNVGEYSLALIADSREEIEQFIADWKLENVTIEENESVQQTL